MAVTIEFYGSLRERSGAHRIQLNAADFGAVIEALDETYPTLAGKGSLLDDVDRSFRVFHNGRRFIKDPQTALADGDRLVMISADAGG